MLTSVDITEARQRIGAAYDPELVRSAGHRLVDHLAEHFHRVEACEGDVLPWREPAQNVQEAKQCLEHYVSSEADRQQITDRFCELAALMLQRGHNLHNPRYIGHQVPASAPLASLFDRVWSPGKQFSGLTT